MRDISVGPRGPPPLVCATDLALPLAAREHGRRVYGPQCRGGIRRRQVSCSGTPSPSAPPVGTLSSTGTPSSLTTDTPETAVAALPLGPAAEEVPWPHVNHLRPQELPRGESTVSVAGDLVAHDGVSRDPNPLAGARERGVNAGVTGKDVVVGPQQRPPRLGLPRHDSGSETRFGRRGPLEVTSAGRNCGSMEETTGENREQDDLESVLHGRSGLPLARVGR
jgi:hypothetical protein